MATIKQIAELAGVSRGTVDRVFNKRGSVNEKTAARILEIAQSVGYVPNKAKSLTSPGKGIKIGYILFSKDSNRFFGQIEKGIMKKAAELADYGVTIVIRYGNYTEPTYQDQLIDDLVEQNVVGIVLCAHETAVTANKIRKLAKIGIPVVTCNIDIPGSGRLSYVGCDYVKSGRAGGNLMKLFTGGHANIGIIGFSGTNNQLVNGTRVRAFREYIDEMAPDMRIVELKDNGDDDFRSFSIVNEMFREREDINALFLPSSGVYGVCRAVEMLPSERRPVIICYDCNPEYIPMLKNGILSAAICQQPEYQGSKPLDILFNYLVLGAKPSKEFYYTNLEILIGENVQG
ncbi:MAG: LacI family DNA-binding transcriptional regulator [Eubacteriales bacterium]|nr:LacI family DNA-binding transcriptional regulator [Eubacteriales bacterium]